VLLELLVVGCDCLGVLLAPLPALQSRKFFRERALERGGKIDAGLTRRLEQVAAKADVGGALCARWSAG
jgi:hypothetical protein